MATRLVHTAADRDEDIASKLNALLGSVHPPELAHVQTREVLNLLAVSPRTGDVLALTEGNCLQFALTSQATTAEHELQFVPLALEGSGGAPIALDPKERLTRLSFNTDGTAAVLHGPHSLYVVRLFPWGLSDKAPGSARVRLDEIADLDRDILGCGAGLSDQEIVQVEWHPAAVDHLVVLTERRLALCTISATDDPTAPHFWRHQSPPSATTTPTRPSFAAAQSPGFRASPNSATSAELQLQSPTAAPPKAVEPSSRVEQIVALNPTGEQRREDSAVAFCFGALHGWHQFTVWVLTSCGAVRPVCPLAPSGFKVPGSEVLSLLQDGLAELTEAVGPAAAALRRRVQWLETSFGVTVDDLNASLDGRTMPWRGTAHISRSSQRYREEPLDAYEAAHSGSDSLASTWLPLQPSSEAAPRLQPSIAAVDPDYAVDRGQGRSLACLTAAPAFLGTVLADYPLLVVAFEEGAVEVLMVVKEVLPQWDDDAVIHEPQRFARGDDDPASIVLARAHAGFQGGAAPMLLVDPWATVPLCVHLIHSTGITQMALLGVPELEAALADESSSLGDVAVATSASRSAPESTRLGVAVSALRLTVRRLVAAGGDVDVGAGVTLAIGGGRVAAGLVGAAVLSTALMGRLLICWLANGDPAVVNLSVVHVRLRQETARGQFAPGAGPHGLTADERTWPLDSFAVGHRELLEQVRDILDNEPYWTAPMTVEAADTAVVGRVRDVATKLGKAVSLIKELRLLKDQRVVLLRSMESSQRALVARYLPEAEQLRKQSQQSAARLEALIESLDAQAGRAVNVLAVVLAHLPQLTAQETKYHKELRALEARSRRWSSIVQALQAHVHNAVSALPAPPDTSTEGSPQRQREGGGGAGALRLDGETGKWVHSLLEAQETMLAEASQVLDAGVDVAAK